MSKIEWTNKTWNPIVGCSRVSPGCEHCYAETMARRLKAMGRPEYRDVVSNRGWTRKVNLLSNKLDDPFHWKKPRMVFVNSMSDLFHEDVPDEFIQSVFRVMHEAKAHTFQILTKRPERMHKFLTQYLDAWPLIQSPNVWLGVSVENQELTDERVPILLSTPARIHFLSVEPMLGPIDLTRISLSPPSLHKGFTAINYPTELDCVNGRHMNELNVEYDSGRRVDWVIVGGESGPNRRLFNPDWARSIRDQCKAANVPFFMKQIDKVAPIPKDLMIREFPQ